MFSRPTKLPPSSDEQNLKKVKKKEGDEFFLNYPQLASNSFCDPHKGCGASLCLSQKKTN
jgi:hypothetical protein